MYALNSSFQRGIYLPTVLMVATLMAVIGSPLRTFAQVQDNVSISTGVDESEVFFGESIRLAIRIDNAKGAPKPSLKELEKDFKIEFLGESPVQNSFRSNINGRVTTLNLYRTTLSYSLTAKRPGSFEIPALSFIYQGNEYSSDPIQLRVVEPEPQDFVLVEVSSSAPHVYPTQAFEVSVVVLVKALPSSDVPSLQYLARRPPEMNVPWVDVPNGLASEQTLNWLNPLVTDQGYGFSINGLAASSGSLFGSPSLALFDLYDGQEKRQDASGEEVLYHRYVLRRSFRTSRAGTFPFGPVVVKGTFPIRMEGQQIVGKKIFVASGSTEVIAKEVPSPRPDTFIGGVGKYSVLAQASPHQCKVGDPITLTLEFSTSDGNLELVSAPKLESIPEIAEGFELLDTDPIGILDNGVKRYRYAMRPKSVRSVIPALEFHVFDPTSESFQPIETSSIPLEIEEAEFVEMARSAKNSPSSGQASESGLEVDADTNDLANGSIRFLPTQLENNATDRLNWRFAVATAVTLWGASLIYIGFFFAQRRWGTSFTSSNKRNWRIDIQARLDAAKFEIAKGNGTDALLDQRRLLAEILSSNTKENVQVLTTDELVQSARSQNYSTETVELLQELMSETDAKRYSPQSQLSDLELLSKFKDVFERMLLEKDKKQKPSVRKLSSSAVIGLLVLAAYSSGNACLGTSIEPLPDQSTVLTQRLRGDITALEARSIAVQLTDQVHDIVHKPGMAIQIGNAWFLAGEFPRALYCYEMAARYWPGNADVAHNRNVALAALGIEQAGTDQSAETSGTNVLHGRLQWLRRCIPSYGVQLILFVLIGGIGAASFAWAVTRNNAKGWATNAISIPAAFILLWVTYNNSPEEFYNNVGLVTEPSTVREGMSDKSPMAFTQGLRAGDRITVLKRTPNWTFIRHPEHGVGWLDSTKLIYQFR